MEPPYFPSLEAELKENIFDIRQRLLIIDSRYISFDDKIMLCENVTAVRYGSMQMLIFHKLRTDKYYRIELMDNKENTMKIFFGHSKLSSDDSGRENNYDKIVNSLWHSVKKRLVNEALINIKSGKEYNVGNCKVRQEGVELINTGIFKNKTEFIRWNDVGKKLGYGNFSIYSKLKPSIKCKTNFLHTWNSVVLFSVIEYFLTKRIGQHGSF
jgi:hypothetical protein